MKKKYTINLNGFPLVCKKSKKKMIFESKRQANQVIKANFNEWEDLLEVVELCD